MISYGLKIWFDTFGFAVLIRWCWLSFFSLFILFFLNILYLWLTLFIHIVLYFYVYVYLDYVDLFSFLVAKLSSSWLVKWLDELRLAVSSIFTRESRDAARNWPNIWSVAFWHRGVQNFGKTAEVILERSQDNLQNEKTFKIDLAIYCIHEMLSCSHWRPHPTPPGIVPIGNTRVPFTLFRGIRG